MRRRLVNTVAAIVFVVFVLSGLFVVSNKIAVNNKSKSRSSNITLNYYAVTQSSTSGGDDSKKRLITPRWKHVTKSLSELPRMDDRNTHALFLNSVPKSGAEVLILLLRWLQGRNSFKHVKLKNETDRKLTTLKQENIVYEVETILREQAIPVSMDKTVRFVNFSLFGKQSPTYISMVRDPIQLMKTRYHQNLTTNVIRCQQKHSSCQIDAIQLNIPYFCGHDDFCDHLNDERALMKSKENVEKYYPVVGVLEEIDTTITYVEHKLPYFFKGATAMYKKKLLGLDINKHVLRKKSNGYSYWKQLLKTEMEFYEWLTFRLFRDINKTPFL